MAKKSATLGSGVVSGYLGVLGKQTDLPHDAVEGRDTEKVPFGGNPAPELILCERFPARLYLHSRELDHRPFLGLWIL